MVPFVARLALAWRWGPVTELLRTWFSRVPEHARKRIPYGPLGDAAGLGFCATGLAVGTGGGVALAAGVGVLTRRSKGCGAGGLGLRGTFVLGWLAHDKLIGSSSPRLRSETLRSNGRRKPFRPQ